MDTPPVKPSSPPSSDRQGPQEPSEVAAARDISDPDLGRTHGMPSEWTSRHRQTAQEELLGRSGSKSPIDSNASGRSNSGDAAPSPALEVPGSQVGAQADNGEDVTEDADGHDQDTYAAVQDEDGVSKLATSVLRRRRPSRTSSPSRREEANEGERSETGPGAEDEEVKGDDMEEQPKSDGEDEVLCRICFSGEDEDGGKLISPCMCKGTMRYVHISCLNRWRRMSAGANSSFRCDQCHYEYNISRTWIAGLANNRVALIILTASLFLVLSFLAGFLATLLLQLPIFAPDSGRSVYAPTFGVGVGDLGEAVGDAVRALNNLPIPEDSLFHNPDDDEYEDDERVIQRNAIPTYDADSTSYRYVYTTSRDEALVNGRWYAMPSTPISIVMHVLRGLGLIGILSFLQLVPTLSFFGGPMRQLRVVRAGGRGGERVADVIVVAMVIVGCIKAVLGTFRLIRRLSRLVLSRIEGAVLEVGERG